METIATLDIGTNAALLWVGTVTPTLHTIVDLERVTGLGKGSHATGALTEEGILRGLVVVREFRAIAEQYGATVHAVATSGVRDARNGGEFVRRGSAALGAKISTITGEREAELTYQGALLGLPTYDSPLVVDIGGGSTEFAWRSEGELQTRSVRIGSVRDHERYSEAASLRAYFDEQLQEILHVATTTPHPWIFVAGTALTLGALGLGRPAAELGGAKLLVRDLCHVEQQLWHTGLPERLALPYVDPGRAEFLPTGASLMRAICEAANLSSLTLSLGGVRTGLALEQLRLGTR